jgi:hypothetical protein
MALVRAANVMTIAKIPIHTPVSERSGRSLSATFGSRVFLVTGGSPDPPSFCPA